MIRTLHLCHCHFKELKPDNIDNHNYMKCNHILPCLHSCMNKYKHKMLKKNCINLIWVVQVEVNPTLQSICSLSEKKKTATYMKSFELYFQHLIISYQTWRKCNWWNIVYIPQFRNPLRDLLMVKLLIIFSIAKEI